MITTSKLQPWETPPRTAQVIAIMRASRAHRERRWILRNIERGPMLIKQGMRRPMFILPAWLYALYEKAAKGDDVAKRQIIALNLDADWDQRLACLREPGAGERLRAAARNRMDLTGAVAGASAMHSSKD